MFAACRSDTELSKRNIEEHWCLSWYLVRPSRLRSDWDRCWWEVTHYPRQAIPEHLGSCHLRWCCKDQFQHQGKETFSFKNKTAQILDQPQYEPRKRTNRRNKQNRNKQQVWTESAKMVSAIHRGQDCRLKSPFLIKKDDPSVPSIKCTINGYSF